MYPYAFTVTDDLTPTTQLNITTLNVNGLLHEDNKRQKTYEMLIIRKTEIAFLQETHSTPDAIRKWKKEWQGKSIWHSSTISKHQELQYFLKRT